MRPNVTMGVWSWLLPALTLGQPLPEGHTGIAAHYVGDADIGSDPSVLFADGFESAAVGRLAGWDVWDNVWGDVRVVADANKVHRGRRAVEMAHPGASSSLGASRDFGTDGHDVLHLRYYIKYHANFPGAHHSGGTILAGDADATTGSVTGIAPDGTNHYLASIDAVSPYFSWTPPGNRPPGITYVYCYHMEQASVGDPRGQQWGDIFYSTGDVNGGRDLFGETFVPRPNYLADRDRWYAFELMVQANTPGARDGRIAVWIDGALVAEFPNLRLRSVATLKNKLAVIGTWASQAHADKSMWFDDVVVATRYIGPMAPRAPTRLQVR
ncbi:MAG: hypothetical protein ACR2RB_20995 [Gammaproteobacteria bacterium]